MKVDFLISKGGPKTVFLNTRMMDDENNIIHREKFSLPSKNLKKNIPVFIMSNYGDLFVNEKDLKIRFGANVPNSGFLQEFKHQILSEYPSVIENEEKTPLPKIKGTPQNIDNDYLGLLKAKLIKGTVVNIHDIYLKDHKKRGLVISTYKDGFIQSSKKVLKNGGVSSDEITYADFITEHFKDYDKSTTILIEKKKNVEFFRYNIIKNTLQNKLKIKQIHDISSPNEMKHHNSILGNNAISEYNDKLEKELAKPEHNVVYIDGSKKNTLTSSGYILTNNKKIRTKSILLGDHKSYEELATLIAIHDILKDDELSKNKTHLVCDYDGIESIKTVFENPSTKTRLQDSLVNSPLFKEVNKLYNEKPNKIYFHFVKSHEKVNSLSRKGNKLIDKLVGETIDENKMINSEFLVTEYDFDKLKDQTFINKNVDEIERELNTFQVKLEKKGVFNFKNAINEREDFKAGVKVFVRYNEKHKRFILDVENKNLFEPAKEKSTDLLKGFKALKMLNTRNLQILTTNNVLEHFTKSLSKEEVKYLETADNVSIFLCNTERQINKLVQERRQKANSKTLKDYYNRNFQKQIHAINKKLELKEDDLFEIIQENKTEKKEDKFKKEQRNNIQINFDNAFGNEELFPKQDEISKNKNVIIVKYGNKTMNIHKFEEGTHTIKRYSQDDSPVSNLNDFLKAEPFQDNSKNLVLSMPNSNGLAQLGRFIRGEEHKNCEAMKVLLNGKKKDSIFITKTIDFMSPMIENDVKWYTENLLDIPEPKETNKRQKRIKP